MGDNQVTAGSWNRPDSNLEDLVRSQRGAALKVYTEDPKYLEEHTRQENSFRTSGYSRRQITELVQNAADAVYRSGSVGDVELVLTPNALYCANEGLGFEGEGIDAVTHAYLSDKRGNEIGRYGLGFKSVLSVTDNPQVFSRTVSFEFGSDEARSALRSVGATAESTPLLRLPTLLNASDEFRKDKVLDSLASWATTVVRLPLESADPGPLIEQLESFQTQFLIFSPHIRSLRMRIADEDGTERAIEHTCAKKERNTYAISGPRQTEQTWAIFTREHRPTQKAMSDVDDAIARKSIVVTFAAPLDGKLDRGEFWANFPLSDQTSARGIFNAPWALNEDRSAILTDKLYNRQIFETLAELFVASLPLLRTSDAPAKHLRYMPSRTKERINDADGRLITQIHHLAAHAELIPDSTNTLRNARHLVALEHDLSLPQEIMRHWSEAPHTPANVPHDDCYDKENFIRVRLREMYRRAYFDESSFPRDAELREPAATEMKFAQWLSWLGNTDDTTWSILALRLLNSVNHTSRVPSGSAIIVPTNYGRRVAISSSSEVHLPAEGTAVIEGYELVIDEVAEDKLARRALTQAGFTPLDERIVFRTCLNRLDEDSEDDAWDDMWSNSLNVEMKFAAGLFRERLQMGKIIKLPTEAGTWRDSTEVFDLRNPSIALPWSDRVLDRGIVAGPLADATGVITEFSPDWPVIEEEEFNLYRVFVAQQMLTSGVVSSEAEAGRWGRLDERCPGPIGLLRQLAEEDSSDTSNDRLQVSNALVRANAKRNWTFVSPDGSDSFQAIAPHLWAIMEWGLDKTSLGVRRVSQAVHPQLLAKYWRWLPVASSHMGALPLPDKLEQVPRDYLETSLKELPINPVTEKDSGAIVEYLLEILPLIAVSDIWDGQIPALDDNRLQSVPAANVYFADNLDDVNILRSSGLAYLLVTNKAQKEKLLKLCAARSASEVIQFQVIYSEARQGIRLTDCFPTLVPYLELKHRKLEIVQCTEVMVRQVTPAGTEDSNRRMVADSDQVYTTLDPFDTSNAHTILTWLNREVGFQLGSDDIDAIVEGTRSGEVESLKAECRAATTDAKRLALLVDTKSLRTKLPSGLVETLEALDKPVSDDRLPSLFLDAHGFEALNQVKDVLTTRRLLPPDRWAGSAPARRFVRDLGFDERFAGEAAVSKPDSMLILGKPNLGELHDYQKEALNRIRFLIRSNPGHADKGLVELPTGAGKTRVAVESLARAFLDRDFQRSAPVLWVAQSVELCEQAIATWSEVWRELSDDRPLTLCRFFESHHPDEPDTELSVVIATEAMLAEHLDNEEYSWVFDPVTVVVDEAHRAAKSPQFINLFERMGVGSRQKERPLIGLSATPYRGRDAEATKALANRFGSNLIQTLGDDPVRELQKRRVLSLVDHDVLPGMNISLNDTELADVRTWNRLSGSALNKIAMDEQRTKRIVEDLLERPADWKILVFMPSVLSAQVLAAVLNAEGVKASAVSGRSSRRQRQMVVENFRDGDLQVLVNCDLLTQGFDAPQVRALYVARPTLSQSFYMQMVGRGLRGPKNNGSERCLVVDLEDTINNDIDVDLAYREFETQWTGMNK